MSLTPGLRRLSRACVRGLVLVLAMAVCAAGARPAHALQISEAGIAQVDGWAAVSVRLSNVLSERIRNTLDRGMPTTVVVRVDLWRDRSGWFDPLVAEHSVFMRAFRNAWSDEFLLRRNLEPERSFLDIAELETEVTRPTRILLTPLAKLDPRSRYYAIVTVTVKPLTVEDLEAVEKWLSGEAKRTGKPGPGSIAKLPRYLVGVLANLSGLGDEVTTWRSESFYTDELAP